MNRNITGRDNFEVMAENKTEFARRICSCDEIAQCLICGDSNFKDYVLTEDDRDNLLWNHVFPCKYTVDTATEKKSYITMGFSYYKSNIPSIYKIGEITFYIFCHKDLIRTDYGILRYDYLLEYIDKIMNNSYYETWYNRMEFNSMDEIVIDSDGNYVGLRIVYTAKNVS